MTPKERRYLVSMWTVVQKIAVGRHDNGRPLGGEASRQLARRTLTELGESWHPAAAIEAPCAEDVNS